MRNDLRRSKPWRKSCFDSASICSFPPNSSEIIVTQMALNDFLCNLYIYIAIIIFLNFYHYLFIEKISHSVPFYSCIVRNIIFFEINCNYDPICLQMQRSGFELGPGICREWTRTGLQTHSGFESAVRRRRRKKARWRRRRRRRGKKEKEKGGKRGCALHTSRLHTVIYGATKIIAAVKIPRGVFIDRHALPPRDCSWNEAALETTRLRLSRL